MKINHKKDKELLINLCEHLFISKRNLKRDELNYWRLVGKRGFIDTDGEYWYVRIECKSKTIWNHVKSSLRMMVKWQDGEAEGALRLERYPTEEEAQKIRKILGFTARKQLSQEEKEKLLERFK